MPKSLSPIDYEVIRFQREKIVKPRPRIVTTVTMVQNTLIELHNIKGVSLRKMYKHILEKYNLESITKKRAALIKKYLKTLLEREDMANTSGKGLGGCFKLANKTSFCSKISENREKISKLRKSLMDSISENAAKSKKAKNLKERRQHDPINISSVFDTPIEFTQAQTSIAIIDSRVPGAPEVQRKPNKTNTKPVPENDIGTPRSSLPKKGRKLLKRLVK